MKLLQHICRNRINSAIIKRDIQKRIKQYGTGQQLQYPKTFEQKIILLNHPKTIQKLEIIQYGVKYKPGKKYLSLILALSALFFFINEKQLPQKVIDHYFSISNASSLTYFTGYILSPFMFQKPFYIYLPLIPVINQLSKFVSNRWIVGLLIGNGIINGVVGKYLADQRVKEYEVWDQERVVYGQGTYLSLSNILWGALGFKGGFTSIKSRIFLKSVPGLGIIRGGIPLAYICLFYTILQIYFYYNQKKNSELIGISALTGIFTGLLIRRFSPLK